jgi:hypothetical protein
VFRSQGAKVERSEIFSSNWPSWSEGFGIGIYTECERFTPLLSAENMRVLSIWPVDGRGGDGS